MKMTPPENALSAKLSGTKISQDELERRLAAADQKISNVAAGFTDWVGAEVAAAQAALGRLENDLEDGEALQEIFRVAHDIIIHAVRQIGRADHCAHRERDEGRSGKILGGRHE